MQTIPCRVIGSASYMGAASHCININEMRLSLLTVSLVLLHHQIQYFVFVHCANFRTPNWCICRATS